MALLQYYECLELLDKFFPESLKYFHERVLEGNLISRFGLFSCKGFKITPKI